MLKDLCNFIIWLFIVSIFSAVTIGIFMSGDLGSLLWFGIFTIIFILVIINWEDPRRRKW